MKKIYINRLLYLIDKKIPKEKLLHEMYYSFLNNKKLQTVILKSLRLCSLREGLDYIERRIGCRPIALLHGYILSEANLQEGLQSKMVEEIHIWETTRMGIKTAYRKNRAKLILQRIGLFVATMLLYIHNETEISLFIYIVVNTIGVILFIVLDYEGVVVDENIRDRKVAKYLEAEKKTLAPAMWLKNIFQLAGCAGLIINIAMLSSHCLGQVI